MRASSPTTGRRSPICMMSRTSLRRAPSLPPGWNTLKCSAVKPRFSRRATARASPSASWIVVEVVGASPLGQASLAFGRVRQMSAARPEGRFRIRGQRDQRHPEAPGIGDDVGKLRRLARPGQGDDHVVGLDHAEIAVARLGRMDVMGGGAGRGEGGGDLAAHMARLAHAGDDDPAPGRSHGLDRGREEGAEAVADGLHQDRQAVPLGLERAQGRGDGRSGEWGAGCASAMAAL